MYQYVRFRPLFSSFQLAVNIFHNHVKAQNKQAYIMQQNSAKIAKINEKISQFRGVIKPSETRTVQRRWGGHSVREASKCRPLLGLLIVLFVLIQLNMMRVQRPVPLQDFVQLKAKISIFVFVVRIFVQVVNVTINKLRIRLRLSGLRLMATAQCPEEVPGFFQVYE